MGGEVRRSIFDSLNIRSLREWQRNMLQKHVYESEGKNNGLVLAPTSGGKTLVAIILLIRTMMIEKKDAILALPYVAIVAEKVRELKQLATELNFFTVMEYAGPKGSFPIPKQRSKLRTLYVATTEKANAIWNGLCRDGREQEIGLVSFDEFHMVADGMRGMIIEELLVSLLHRSSECTRVLALSATVGNASDVRDFLGGGHAEGCDIHHITQRPIGIEEHLVVAGAPVLIERDEVGVGMIKYTDERHQILQDEDLLMTEENSKLFPSYDDQIIARLLFDAIKQNKSVLVFCNTRNKCVSMCDALTKAYQSMYR